MAPLRVVVAEDEPHQRARLDELLRARPGVEVVATCADGRAALDTIRQARPDLVFLDVEMPEGSGLDVLAELGPDAPVVVFVTAFDQYAVKAFELHAFDYLLKPFDDARFEAVLDRAARRVRLGQVETLSHRLLDLLTDLRAGAGGGEAPGEASAPAAAPAAAEGGYLERLGIRVGGRMLLVRAAEIDWIAGAGVYAEVHTGPRRYHVRQSLTNLEARLHPDSFVRIHRSTIVNVNRVRELVPAQHGEYAVILEDGTKLKLSRNYRDRLEALMGGLG